MATDEKIIWDESDEEEEEDDGVLGKWIEGDSLAPYVGTPVSVLDEAFEFAGLCDSDVVLDIGCGDGRIPIWAVLRGARRGIGLEIDEQLVCRAIANSKKHKLSTDTIQVLHGDITARDDTSVLQALNAATLIVTYLLPEALQTIEPILLRFLAENVSKDTKRRRLLTLGWPPQKAALTPIATRDLGADLAARGGATMDAFLFDSTSLSVS